MVELMTCVGKTGKLESTRITRRQSPDEYVRAVEAAAAARSFTPFVVHGKAVRACAVELIAYPLDRRARAFSTPVFAPPPPSPPPPPPLNVPPNALEASRLSGEKNIVPDVDTKAAMLQNHKNRVVGTYKVCITTAGKVSSVTQLKSTGFAAYDAELMDGIRTWTYRPFLVNGKPAAVCTAVTFIYRQTTAPPPPPDQP